MRRLLFLALILIVNPLVQAQEPAPTLVPPTPVPRADSGEQEILPSESAIARIRNDGVVRVGILYNEPPFGELNIRGMHSGYDADLARSIADVWGVEIKFVQVTRSREETARMLRRGDIDMVAAALVHHREYDAVMEFSQTYYTGRQTIMVRADDPATRPPDMAGRRIGVTIATSAEEALNGWIARNNINAAVETYLTLDQAYVALVVGEIDGVVSSHHRLRQVSILRPELTRFLESPLEPQPYAMAFLRQDVNMRDLVNRTLQYLTTTGRLYEINQAFFPGEFYDGVTVWKNIGEDVPSPEQYPTGLTFPAERAVPRLQSTGTVRVAGLIGVTADSDAPESERRLDAFHRQMMETMASRWGVNVEFITDGNPLEQIAGGQADLAVGVEPDWAWKDRLDFTQYYLVHGERLMVRAESEAERFADLRTGGIVRPTIITPANEESAVSRTIDVAETVPMSIDVSQQREQDLALMLLDDPDRDFQAVFGDSFKLIPHVQANPDLLRLTTEGGRNGWYSPSNIPGEDFRPRMMAMALPRNDIDFYLLLEYTLQTMAHDGTLYRLMEPLVLPNDIPIIEVWPGPDTYLGYELGG